METKLTVSATQDLVTKDGQLLIIEATMKRNCQLSLIPVGFGTSNKLSTTDDEVTSIDGHVDLVTELDFTFDDDSVENWG